MTNNYPHTYNLNFYLTLQNDTNDHSQCNHDPIIHEGNHLDQLGCIHNNPNDSSNENAVYMWSKKYRQWKRLRYWKTHYFCKFNKKCVYWDDSLDIYPECPCFKNS